MTNLPSLMENSSPKKRVTITLSPVLEGELRSIQADLILESPKSFSQVISMLLTEALLQRKAQIPPQRVPDVYSY